MTDGDPLAKVESSEDALASSWASYRDAKLKRQRLHSIAVHFRVSPSADSLSEDFWRSMQPKDE